MPDFLLAPEVAIYIALGVALTVWLGLFTFLWRIDQRIRELCRQVDQMPPEATPVPRATLETRRVQEET